jgi:hypothetical protein
VPVSQELAWLAEVLWGPTPRLRVLVGEGGPPGFRTLAAWGILPGRGRPRVLVPLGAPRAAAGALRQYNDAMSLRARLAKALAGGGLRSGVPQRLLVAGGSVLWVGAAGDGEGGGADRAETLLPGYVAEALGRDDLAAAILLGPVRPNRKPVVQLLDPAGRPVGYVKVGWNELTRRLVRREAAMLRRLAAFQPRALQVPRLLHQGRWHDLEVTISSALPHRLRHHGRRGALPPSAAGREVAALGGITRAALGGSPYWADLRGRLAALQARADGRASERLDGLLAALAARASSPLWFGSWHGDWGPWNMRATPGRLLVWDWERSGDGVPLGFDPLHFTFQTGRQQRGEPVGVAAGAALRRAAGALAELGQETDAGELVLDLYLAERLCRAGEAESSAVTGRPDAVGAALLGTLERRLGADPGRVSR